MREDSRWQRYWRYLSKQLGRDVDEELNFHVQMRARELEARGLSREAAMTEAGRRFGDQGRVKSQLERIEQRRGKRLTLGFFVEELLQDLRYAARGLLKRPGFSFMTASSLALGIAATTVVLSVVDSWLLRPLPVRDPGQLVVIGASNHASGSLVTHLISLPTVREIQARRDLFSDAAAVRLTMVGARRPEGQSGQPRLLFAVTGNYFPLLGVSAAVGRTLIPDDDLRRERVIVLSHRFWSAEWGADRSVIGKLLYLNTVPFTIIGLA